MFYPKGMAKRLSFLSMGLRLNTGRYVDAGHFTRTGMSEDVTRGKKVGTARAANKGACGMPFRFYDTTLVSATAPHHDGYDYDTTLGCRRALYSTLAFTTTPS